MTKDEARELLKRAEAGEEVPEREIIAALFATGDIDSDFALREARQRMKARLHKLKPPAPNPEDDPALTERRTRRNAGTWEKRAARFMARTTWLDALH
jgi:plasmid stability protein